MSQITISYLFNTCRFSLHRGVLSNKANRIVSPYLCYSNAIKV